ncbi:putative lysine transport system permease protein [Granulicatella balaenopterae]|uniref:Putative lysine transport system permease protein n=1 Tax=Granulicatella balaenopterae TaxID=137733 RepID=A0A1H9JKC8_9LACT|nr:ABC transporter permease subunit [Granulicatella balaenopterae]SEQ87223.1 putative lysine transport system permease protein [Granulicatella balaenopterae]
MNIKRKITLLVTMLLSIVFVTIGQVNAETADDQFIVGMEAGYPPFNWTQKTNANGAVPIEGTGDYAGGYDVEIAKRIAEDLDKELVIVKTEWDGLTPALVSGKIDAIIAGMSPTEERKQSIDFSTPYYQSNYVMIVKRGGAFENATTLADFSNAKVTAQLNTFHYSLIDQIPNVKKQEAMESFPSMRVALQSGTIDAYVSEMPEGLSVEAVNDDFKMVELTDGFQAEDSDRNIAVGLKKGNPLTPEINAAIDRITPEERLAFMEAAVKNQPAISGVDESNTPWVVKIFKENWRMFLKGAWVTLYISITGTVIGTVIGLGVGLVKTIPTPKKAAKRVGLKIANILVTCYTEFFRGTPMIVQAMVIYYGSALAFGIDMNRIFAAIFIVSINTGAYMSEVVRGGIISIDKGQFEACQAIGMTHFQTMMNVVFPQVIRNILPATGNEFVINIKDTSVLNVISVSELYFATKTVAGSNFRYFETFFITLIIYFIMTTTVTQILRYIERRLEGPNDYEMIHSDPLNSNSMAEVKKKIDSKEGATHE